MKLHEFIESTYVSTNLELQQDFTIWKQAKTQAAHNLVDTQRKFYRLLHYPLLLLSYFKVVLGIDKAPPNPKEIIKQIQDKAKEEAEEKKLKLVETENVAPTKDAKILEV